jgi:hypothetical protein
MATLSALKRSAKASATVRGHKLGAWTTNEARGMAYAECLVAACHAWVQVETKPAANSIEVGGSAVALNCPARG